MEAYWLQFKSLGCLVLPEVVYTRRVEKHLPPMRKLLVVALVFLSAGCQWRDSTPATPASPTPTLPGVQTVVVEGPALVYWPSTSLVQARVSLDNGTTVVSEKATWVSSDPAIATVDTRGVVSAVSSGEAVISGTVGAATGRLTVRVIPDYRGVWHGQTSGEYCGPWYSYTCRWQTGNWETYLRIEQDGASVSGLMYHPTDMNPEDRYFFGHIELDGSLVMDRGFCYKDGKYCSPKVTRWRTSLSQDGATLAGSYGYSYDPGYGEVILELTMHRSE
jgi:hypothetical protein